MDNKFGSDAGGNLSAGKWIETTGLEAIQYSGTGSTNPVTNEAQAIRIATPPTVGFMVQVVKNTSLASVIGFVELTRAGQIVNNSTFEPFVV